LADLITERSFYYAPNAVNTCALTIDGNPNEEQIQKAIIQLSERHEMLRQCILQDENGNCFFTRQKETKLSITEVPGRIDNTIPKLIALQAPIPFQLDKGELVRFFILREDEEVCIMAIAHSLAGDAYSLFYMMRDLLHYLNHPDQSVSAIPLEVIGKPLYPAAVKLNASANLLIRISNLQWRFNGRRFILREYHEMLENFWKERSMGYLCAEITSPALVNSENISALVAAAFQRAAAQHGSTESDSIVMINKSDRREGYEGMSNLSLGVSIRHYDNQSATLLDNASEIASMVSAKLSDPNAKYFLPKFLSSLTQTLVDAVYFNTFNDFRNQIVDRLSDTLGYRGNHKGFSIVATKCSDAFATAQRYCAKSFRFYPALFPNVDRVIGIAVCNNQVTITMQFERGENDQQMEQLFQAATEQLKLI